MTKEKKSEIKYRMNSLARKFCRKNDVYESFDGSVGKLIEKAYLSAYFLCLHENKSRVSELEKENVELQNQHKTEKEKWYAEYTAMYDDFQKQIATLEKENSELKKHHKNVCKNLTDTHGNIREQLTKAKELIEDLIKFQPYINREAIFTSLGNEWKIAIYKAKQFLKGE